MLQMSNQTLAGRLPLPQDSDSVRRRVAEAATLFGAMSDAVDAAAADVLRVNRTDLTILAAVHRAGRTTAGEAATAAALSAPATTAAIQRLVAAGLLAREVDPADRRRAILTLTPLAKDRIEQVYSPIGSESFGHLGGYSPEDLAVIERFLTDGIAAQQQHARRIRSL
ncbi:MAG: hypothetical protein QG622_415 [Actinomycetota bacterium]|nr:hypothetical protein [Actinomycetota bacterium]